MSGAIRIGIQEASRIKGAGIRIEQFLDRWTAGGYGKGDSSIQPGVKCFKYLNLFKKKVIEDVRFNQAFDVGGWILI